MGIFEGAQIINLNEEYGNYYISYESYDKMKTITLPLIFLNLDPFDESIKIHQL